MNIKPFILLVVSIIFPCCIPDNKETQKQNLSPIGNCKIKYGEKEFMFRGKVARNTTWPLQRFLDSVRTKNNIGYLLRGNFKSDKVQITLNDLLIMDSIITTNFSTFVATGINIEINKKVNNTLKITLNDSCICSHSIPKEYLGGNIFYSKISDSIFIDYDNIMEEIY